MFPFFLHENIGFPLRNAPISFYLSVKGFSYIDSASVFFMSITEVKKTTESKKRNCSQAFASWGAVVNIKTKLGRGGGLLDT